MSADNKISKPESQMKQILDEIYPDAKHVDNGFYEDIESHKGHALSLDRYYPEMKLAFEYRGEQHYQYVPFFHKTPSGFFDQLRRDYAKEIYAEKMGIDLIVIRFDQKLTREYIEQRLTERKILKQR